MMKKNQFLSETRIKMMTTTMGVKQNLIINYKIQEKRLWLKISRPEFKPVNRPSLVKHISLIKTPMA